MNFNGNDLVSENLLDSGLSLSVEFRFRRKEKRGFEKSAISSGLTNGDRLFSIARSSIEIIMADRERERESFGRF